MDFHLDDTYLNMLNPNDIRKHILVKRRSNGCNIWSACSLRIYSGHNQKWKKGTKPTVSKSSICNGILPSHRPDIWNAYTLQLVANQLTELTGCTLSPTKKETLLEAKRHGEMTLKISPDGFTRRVVQPFLHG
jgi:hypothetical protein